MTINKIKLEQTTCKICGRIIKILNGRKGLNNTQPLLEGYCCDDCNNKYVIPARIKSLSIR
tara:strand:- start:859 stop:1041 length:183 start_codon:yes stop_codon:yes gene_type:complete